MFCLAEQTQKIIPYQCPPKAHLIDSPELPPTSFTDYYNSTVPQALDQSDAIQCNNYAKTLFDMKKTNDAIFAQQFNMPQPTGCINRCEELKLWTNTFTSRAPNCDEFIMTRGNNLTHKPMQHCAGYQCYPQRGKSEFLMIPCPQNTWNNHLEQDDTKICSVRHQMFNNVTKRR